MKTLFSEGLFSRKPHTDPDIEEFHRKHAELQEIGKRLHEKGHHITIDYDSPNVVRHGKKDGVMFFNHSLAAKHKIQISKQMPLRVYDSGK